MTPGPEPPDPVRVHIRPATPDDFRTSSPALAAAGFTENFKGYERGDVLTLVAEADGTVVGAAHALELMRPDGRRELFLYSIDVEPSWRRRGCGRALIEALLDAARARGHASMWTLTDPNNLAAQELYRSTDADRDGPQIMFSWVLP